MNDAPSDVKPAANTPTERALTLILPTRNEAGNIQTQIAELYRVLPHLKQILVMDDNSTDGTREIAHRGFPDAVQSGRLKIVRRLENPGLAASIQHGISITETPLVGWMDCDLSMPAETVLKLLEKIQDGYDACVGSRFHPAGAQKDLKQLGNDSRAEIHLSNILNHLLKRLLKTPISDFTSGFIIVRTEALSDLNWHGQHGEYFIYLVNRLAARGYQLTEVPYRCGTRRHGTSKTFGTFRASAKNSFRYGKALVGVTVEKFTGF